MRSGLLLLLLLLSTALFAQEKPDSTATPQPEWDTKNYTQVDKIYNRSVWTFVDNPALAGFDRKLAVAYRYRMKNLKMGVPNKKGEMVLAFQQHEAFVDLPFGGPKQNWGMGLYYAYEKELQHTYHRVQMARSLRIRLVKEHYLILGLSFGVQFSDIDWNTLSFGDQIDPRFGFIYATQELNRTGNRIVSLINGGLRYYWKRLAFDYSVQYGPNGVWGLAGYDPNILRNRFKLVYHINAGDDVTISPEFAGNLTLIPTNMLRNARFGLYSGFLTITYKDMVSGQLGISDSNSLRFRALYQFRDMLVFQVGLSSYLNRNMREIAGLGGIDVGIRYQIKAWNR
ncbi:MAG: type IX secretion system membrane protein PorP/SprF [Flavobacteriales bacterium]|nr:type IX secretion system membrane protein PorP/SprF [Flavobacteriales bacterium]